MMCMRPHIHTSLPPGHTEWRSFGQSNEARRIDRSRHQSITLLRMLIGVSDEQKTRGMRCGTPFGAEQAKGATRWSEDTF
jgi:hypothetical protein